MTRVDKRQMWRFARVDGLPAIVHATALRAEHAREPSLCAHRADRNVIRPVCDLSSQSGSAVLARHVMNRPSSWCWPSSTPGMEPVSIETRGPDPGSFRDDAVPSSACEHPPAGVGDLFRRFRGVAFMVPPRTPRRCTRRTTSRLFRPTGGCQSQRRAGSESKGHGRERDPAHAGNRARGKALRVDREAEHLAPPRRQEGPRGSAHPDRSRDPLHRRAQAWDSYSPTVTREDPDTHVHPLNSNGHAGDELADVMMARREKASTIITTNRPFDDSTRLLGDVVVVTPLLDRLMHHGHLLSSKARAGG